MAANDKSLAENNKSCTGGKATKKRSTQRGHPGGTCATPTTRPISIEDGVNTGVEMVRKRAMGAHLTAKNKCLAGRNKTPEVRRATKKRKVLLGGLLEWIISSINLEN